MIFAYDSVMSENFTSNTTRPTVSLSEAMVNPPTGETEWIELYNSSSREVQLEDWHIDDIADGGSSPIVFSGYIEPYDYLVIPVRSSVFNNGGDDVRLLDQSETEVDILRYDESKKSITWARGPGEVTYCLQQPTKGTENQVCRDIVPSHTPTPTVSLASPTPTTSPISSTPPPPPSPTETPTPAYVDTNDIYISEVMVAPETGHKEWIELYNASDQSVTLREWFIDDEEDAGSSPKTFSAEIPAQGYYFHVLSSGIFNNEGDHVRVVSSTEQEVERFIYASSEKGKTWGRPVGEGNTFCLQEATPGFENTDCIDNLKNESLLDQTDTSSKKSETDEQVRNTSETRHSSTQDTHGSDTGSIDERVRGSSTIRQSPSQLALYQDTVRQAPLAQENRELFSQRSTEKTDRDVQMVQGRPNSVHDTVVRVLAGISVLIASVVAFRLGTEFRSHMMTGKSFFPQK